MHIYFSGIGGTGIGPLALICQQAGFDVSGSDMQDSQYTDYLAKHGVNLHIGQTTEQIQAVHNLKPIDWIVFSSAITTQNPKHPELLFAQANHIKTSKRDECLNMLIKEKNLKLIAVAGTHGKTTTTAMLVWLFEQLKIPLSYSVGAKMSFGPMGQFDPKSQYFVYECDEFDRNFLSFYPDLSIITAVDWDHHEIYPTREDYIQAFGRFISQSHETLIYDKDANYLSFDGQSAKILPAESEGTNSIKLAGAYIRQNAYLCVQAMHSLFGLPLDQIINAINLFPGVGRRFEKIANNIYSDYAHTPEEIQATLQKASELSKDVVVAYEPLTDRRQHYMQDQYRDVFNKAKMVYWLPSYLAREDPSLPILQPEDLIKHLSPETVAQPAQKNQQLKNDLAQAANNGSLVICIAGGGGGSLDEWARKELV